MLSWLGAMRARMRLRIWVKCFLMVELQVYLQPQPKHEPTDASLSMGQARQLSWSPKVPSASVANARPCPPWRLSFCIYKCICFTTTRSAINPPRCMRRMKNDVLHSAELPPKDNNPIINQLKWYVFQSAGTGAIIDLTAK